MTTFVRKEDELNRWELVHVDGNDGHVYHIDFEIDFEQGDFIRFTVVCEGNEPSSGYIMFNWALDIEHEDYQGHEVSLGDPRYSEFFEWAKQIINDMKETNQ